MTAACAAETTVFSRSFISAIDFVCHLTSLCVFILIVHDLNLLLTPYLM